MKPRIILLLSLLCVAQAFPLSLDDPERNLHSIRAKRHAGHNNIADKEVRTIISAIVDAILDGDRKKRSDVPEEEEEEPLLAAESGNSESGESENLSEQDSEGNSGSGENSGSGSGFAHDEEEDVNGERKSVTATILNSYKTNDNSETNYEVADNAESNSEASRNTETSFESGIAENEESGDESGSGNPSDAESNESTETSNVSVSENVELTQSNGDLVSRRFPTEGRTKRDEDAIDALDITKRKRSSLSKFTPATTNYIINNTFLNNSNTTLHMNSTDYDSDENLSSESGEVSGSGAGLDSGSGSGDEYGSDSSVISSTQNKLNSTLYPDETLGSVVKRNTIMHDDITELDESNSGSGSGESSEQYENSSEQESGNDSGSGSGTGSDSGSGSGDEYGSDSSVFSSNQNKLNSNLYPDETLSSVVKRNTIMHDDITELDESNSGSGSGESSEQYENSSEQESGNDSGSGSGAESVSFAITDNEKSEINEPKTFNEYVKENSTNEEDSDNESGSPWDDASGFSYNKRDQQNIAQAIEEGESGDGSESGSGNSESSGDSPPATDEDKNSEDQADEVDGGMKSEDEVDVDNNAKDDNKDDAENEREGKADEDETENDADEDDSNDKDAESTDDNEADSENEDGVEKMDENFAKRTKIIQDIVADMAQAAIGGVEVDDSNGVVKKSHLAYPDDITFIVSKEAEDNTEIPAVQKVHKRENHPAVDTTENSLKKSQTVEDSEDALKSLVKSILREDPSVHLTVRKLATKRQDDEEKGRLTMMCMLGEYSSIPITLYRDIIDLMGKDSNEPEDESKGKVITEVKDFEGFVQALSQTETLTPDKHDVIAKKLEKDLLNHLSVTEKDDPALYSQENELLKDAELSFIRDKIDEARESAEEYAYKHVGNLEEIRKHAVASLKPIVESLPLRKEDIEGIVKSITKSAWVKMITHAKKKPIISNKLRRSLEELFDLN